MRAADVARRLNVTPSTASRSLAALATYGLAARGAKGVWEGTAAASADLDVIAAGKGVFVADAQRKALHARQRAQDVTRTILRCMRSATHVARRADYGN